jgi:hypothetical protein
MKKIVDTSTPIVLAARMGLPMNKLKNRLKAVEIYRACASEYEAIEALDNHKWFK